MPTKSKKSAKNGDRYVCTNCGMTLIVDESCGCTELHEFICCDKPMALRKKKKKTKR